MEKKDRQIFFVLTAVLLTSGLVAFLNLGNLAGKATLIFIIATVSTAGYVVIRKNILDGIYNSFEGLEKNSFSSSWDASKAREEIEKWSEKEFEISDSIEFRWNDAEFDEDLVESPKGDEEKLYAFWTSFGEADKKVIVYVNATQQSVGPYRQVGNDETVPHPFAKWSYWKTCQRYMRRSVSIGDQQQQQYPPYVPRGFPNPPNPNPDQSDEEVE